MEKRVECKKCTTFMCKGCPVVVTAIAEYFKNHPRKVGYKLGK